MAMDAPGDRPDLDPPASPNDAREAVVAAVADRIDDWHEGRRPEATLRAALGMSTAEYDRWLRDPAAIPDRPLPS